MTDSSSSQLTQWPPTSGYIAREQTTKKTPVPSLVALLSNGCKQALPLLTVDLQRARHNILSIIN
jgi:hypothetical protein